VKYSPLYRNWFFPFKEGNKRLVKVLMKLSTFCVLALLFFFSHIEACAQPAEGACSLRMEIEGVGVIIVKSPKTSTKGPNSQLLLEKPGGAKIILAESDALIFVGLLKGDLDGDQFPEVVAIAKNPAGDDCLPYIFGGKPEFRQLFPNKEEENPLVGKEIAIVPGKNKSLLCVRELVNIHDFGPPDLYLNKFYSLHLGKLEKVEEKIQGGTHFNQLLNLGALAFQKGEFLDSLKKYETVASSPGVPPEAMATAIFYAGESRKFLKDFSGAIEKYYLVKKQFPDSAVADQAEEELDFLSRNSDASQALSLFVDVSRLQRTGKSKEALSLLDKGIPSISVGNIGDYLLFLRGEILISLEQGEEALKTFREIKSRFPKTPLFEKVEMNIKELESGPDEME